MDHGDFRLYESQAILRYIDRVFAGTPLTPANPRAAARMDQAMNINDWYLFPRGRQRHRVSPHIGESDRLVSWLSRMNARPSLRATTWERVAAMAHA
jgi:glutathione S-transferase